MKKEESRVDFLERLHMQFQTPEEKQVDLIRKATGEEIVSKERILRGEASEVYAVELETGRNVIMRISHGSSYSFLQEKHALDLCEKEAIPVGHMIYLEDFELEGKQNSACVMERLPGKAVDESLGDDGLSKEELRSVLSEAGAILARIHGIRIRGYGRIERDGIGKYASWYSFVNRHREKGESLRKVLEARGLDPKVFDKIHDIFDENRELLESVEPSLLHGDYGPDHIFVNNGQVTGIIDFGGAKSGDPIHDLAFWDFFHTKKYEIEPLLEGYRTVRDLGPNYELLLNINKLFLCLQLLWYFDDTKNESGMRVVEEQLRSSLGYF